MKFLTIMASALLAAPALVSAFVGTSGTKFTNDGKNFYFSGTNAYYLMTQSQSDVQATLSQSASLNLPVIRTWLFNSGNSDVYFQTCENGGMTINESNETGLGRIDYIIQQAAANNVKLIFVLTNNWQDYGGMDYYNKCFGASYHDDFYTKPEIIASFKDYINKILERTNTLTGVKYKDDSTIFAWELANEPRCSGSGSYPTSSNCNPSITTSWIDEISSYIKSIDSNHLVGVGDEGFMNRAGDSEYEYNGGTGMDFEASIHLGSIDFGTFHMYPEHWSKDNSNWPQKWIQDHASVQNSVGKPVILEEYGLADQGQRTNIYPAWHSAIENNNLAADAFWQISVPCNPNLDDFAICPSDSNIDILVKSHASNMLAKN